MDLKLEPLSQRFDPLDDRWLAQVAQLVTDLQKELDDVRRHGKSEPGTKGVELGAIVVSLGSAGMFTAAVEVVKAFVGRDRGRSIRLSWHENGKPESLQIEGHRLGDDVVKKIEQLKVALERSPERSE